MTSDPSRPSEHVLKVPVDAPPEPPLGDRLATALLWIPMFAHAAFDLTALGIIYWNVESSVAHLIFK